MQMRTVQYFSRAGDRNDNDVTSPRMKGNIPVHSATFEEPSGKVGPDRIHRASAELLCFEPRLDGA